MKEIDNSGSEIFPLREPIAGVKHHGKPGASALLAKALLSVAAAGLVTAAVLSGPSADGGPAVYDGPPVIEVPAEPDTPKLPPEEPPDVKPPVKKPEISTPPTTPPPTTPPPTTPPPTTPPPTTPPPTTPPPTTPPPTTPPPYVPPYDPPADTFTEPTLELIDDGVWGWYNVEDLQVEVGFQYRVDLGSAKWYRLYWSSRILGWPNTFESSESIYSENSDTGSGTLICSQFNSGDDTTPPPTLPGEGTLFLRLECDTGTTTYSYPFEIPW